MQPPTTAAAEKTIFVVQEVLGEENIGSREGSYTE